MVYCWELESIEINRNIRTISDNPFVTNASIRYPLKTSPEGFPMFSGGRQRVHWERTGLMGWYSFSLMISMYHIPNIFRYCQMFHQVEMFYNWPVVKNFAKSIRNHLQWRLFQIEMIVKVCNFTKKVFWSLGNFLSKMELLAKIFGKSFRGSHCVKSVRIRSYCGSYFPAFGLNTERYSVYLHIHSECGKIRTRITPNMNTFMQCLWTTVSVIHFKILKGDFKSK